MKTKEISKCCLEEIGGAWVNNPVQTTFYCRGCKKNLIFRDGCFEYASIPKNAFPNGLPDDWAPASPS
jgi:hypothetical protein